MIVICWVLAPRSTVNWTRSPGSVPRSAAMSSSAFAVSRPFKLVMMSPGWMPASAAGLGVSTCYVKISTHAVNSSHCKSTADLRSHDCQT